MSSIASLARIANLIGEPARTAMLVTLMDGRALTAGELGEAAGVAPPTASGHLARLLEAGLLALERQGRHRYYRVAGHEVAAMLEGMMALSGELDGASSPRRIVVTSPRDRALRRARLCHDHLAGEVAVAIVDRMRERGQLDFARDGGDLTAAGAAFLGSIGMDVAKLQRSARHSNATFCRPCLDWSERRPHIAGAVGRMLLATFTSNGWMRRAEEGRAVIIPPFGISELERHFGTALA